MTATSAGDLAGVVDFDLRGDTGTWKIRTFADPADVVVELLFGRPGEGSQPRRPPRLVITLNTDPTGRFVTRWRCSSRSAPTWNIGR